MQQVVLAGHTSPGARAVLADGADLAWADGFIFTSQIHTGLMSAAMKTFIDEHHDAAETGAFMDRTFTAMATGGYDHAGQESVVAELNAAAAVWGCLVVTPSGADAAVNHLNGNPWGLSFLLEHGRIAGREAAEQVLRSHLRRFVALTEAMAGFRRSHHAPVQAPTKEKELNVHSATNPLRAVDVLGSKSGSSTPSGRPAGSASGSPGASGSSGGSGAGGSGSSGSASGSPGHSPMNPLRATDVFGLPAPGYGTGSAGGSRSSRTSSAQGGSVPSGQGSGSGHSPYNPLRATDVFGS